uniref:Uncharacterized protein n=1 Tax=Arundo donax TaxID=35708 RepID=A0A0A8ZKV2_ARUDO
MPNVSTTRSSSHICRCKTETNQIR